MAVELASGYISLVPSTKGFGRDLDRQLGPEVDKASRDAGARAGDSFTSSFGSTLKLAAVAGAALAGVAIGGLVKDSIEAASNLGETLSKVSVVIGKEALPGLESWAEGAATAFGQSKQQALDAAATFAVFGKSAGLTGGDLAGFSTELSGLASDMASFSNTTTDEAIVAIGAALRGESEPIRQYGVLLDDATLKNRALELGLISTTKNALTPQQRVLAAQAEILAQTTDAQGDFARTSGGLANQLRILKAQLANGRAELGKAFLPAVTQVVTFLTSKGIPGFQKFTKEIKDKLVPILPTLGKALLVLSGPFGIAVLAIIKNFDKIKQAFKDFTSELDGVGTPVTGFFGKLGDSVGKFVKNVQLGLDSLRASFSGEGVTTEGWIGAVERIGAEARRAVDIGREMVDAGASAAKAFFEGLLTGVKDGDLSGVSAVAATIGITLKGAFIDVKGAIEGSRDVIKDIFTFVDDHKDAFTVAAAGLGAFIASLKTIQTIQTGITAAQGAVATLAALAPSLGPLLANPVGLAVSALVAVGVAAFVAYKKFKPFRDAIDATARVIRDVAVTSFEKFRDIATTVAPVVRDAFVTAFHAVVRAFDAVRGAVGVAIGAIVVAFNAVSGAIGTVVDVLARVAVNIIDALRPAAEWFDTNFLGTFRAGAGFLDAVFDHIRSTVATVARFIGKVISDVAPVFADVARLGFDLFGRLIALFGDLASVAFQLLGPAFRFIGKVVQQSAVVIAAFLAFAGPAWEFFSKTVAAVVIFAFNQVKSTIENVLGVIRGVFRLLEGVVRGDWGKVWQGITGIVSSTFGVVIDLVKNAFVLIVSIFRNINFTSIGETFLNLAKTVQSALGEVITALFKWFVDTTPVIAAQLLEWSVAFGDWVLTSALPWLLTKLGELVAGIGSWIVEATPGFVVKLIEWAVVFADWVTTSALPWLLAKLGELGVAVIKWIADLVPVIVTKALELTGAILGWVGDAVRDAPGRLAELASVVLGFIAGLPEQIATAAAGMWDGIGEAFKSAINFIIRTWNSLPPFEIPGFDPPGPGSFGGFTFGLPKIDELAGGGVFTSDFTGLLRLAETPAARPEIVTPQRLMAETFRKVLVEVGGGRGRPLIEGGLYVTEAASANATVDAINAKLGWMLTTRNER